MDPYEKALHDLNCLDCEHCAPKYEINHDGYHHACDAHSDRHRCRDSSCHIYKSLKIVHDVIDDVCSSVYV